MNCVVQVRMQAMHLWGKNYNITNQQKQLKKKYLLQKLWWNFHWLPWSFAINSCGGWNLTGLTEESWWAFTWWLLYIKISKVSKKFSLVYGYGLGRWHNWTYCTYEAEMQQISNKTWFTYENKYLGISSH